MAEFPINPLQQFAGTKTAIKRPKEIACFSYDEHRTFHPNDSSLKYYYPPALPANLSKGYETFVKRDDTPDEHLQGLLKSVIAYEKENSRRCDANIITWRGMMTKIMTAPFDLFSEFEMNATFYQGTIFIEENHDFKLSSRDRQDEHRLQPGQQSQALMAFWGYKFETLCVLNESWDKVPRDQIENRDSYIVNNHEQYCSVVQTEIGNTNLILGGEVDAVWDCKPEDNDQSINWVELKTSEEILNDKSVVKFERKLLRIWAQSFLLGVPKIIVGFRSKEGVLLNVEEMDTHSIPGSVKRKGQRTWDGNICINFTATFLDFLREKITEPGIWRIRRKHKASHLELLRIHDQGHGEILSSEFIEWRNQFS